MKKVLLLLANGFEIYEAAAFIDVFGWNLVDGDKSTQLYTVGLTRDVRSSFNQRIVVDFTLDQVSAADFEALAIPGGFEEFGFYTDAYSADFLTLIRDFHEQGKPIASICVGALPVARSGILDGKRATTYQLNPARPQALSQFGAIITPEKVVEDDHVITSCNPGTAIDVALKLLEKLTSKENATHIREIMGF